MAKRNAEFVRLGITISILNFRQLIIGLFILVAGFQICTASEERILRTGLEADWVKYFSVSPEGKSLLFSTNRLAHGLKQMNLSTGAIQSLPSMPGRYFHQPSWSLDGQKVVAVSARIENNLYKVEDMQIVLLDPVSWSAQVIASGEGVKFFPFFSTDGKTVYYIKGKKRENGKTVAASYDLFAIELATGVETRLTYEEVYQMENGDENSETILFSALGRGKFAVDNPVIKGFKSLQTAPFTFDKSTNVISQLKIDQSSGFFDFYQPRRDKSNNLYFVASTHERGKPFRFFLVHADKEGNNPTPLTEMKISMGFAIARNTGEIYVADKEEKEIVIRRLSAKADH